MGRSSTPPAPPDYTGAAEKTAASNQDSQTRADWANRPTVNMPWGQESWKASSAMDPSTGKPITQWEQSTTLTPDSQRALDAQMGLETGRSELASGMMGRVSNDFSKPFDWGTLPARATTPTGGMMTSRVGNDLTGFGRVDDSKVNAMGGDVGTNLQDFGRVDRSQINGMGGDVSSMVGDASRQRIEQGLLDRLRPEQDRASSRLETQLANKGLTPGSAAYEQERQRLSDSQSRQQFDALLAGGQEQRNQFDMALGAGEYDNRRNAQGFGQQMQEAGMADSQRGQQFGEQVAEGEYDTRRNAQGFGQEMERAGMADSQRGQQFDEQLGAGEFRNAAQQQRFGQRMDSANFQNQNRASAQAEQMAQRNMSLNEMNALLSGQQIGMPDMPGFNESQSAGGTNYYGAAKDQYGGVMNMYNAGQQDKANKQKAVASMASTAMMVF